MSGNPSVQRRRLGLMLKELRTSAGLTGDEAGAHLERTGSWVSRIEAGRSSIRVHDLEGLLDKYGVDDPKRRATLAALARGGKGKGWWNAYGQGLSAAYKTFLGFEADARRLVVYDALVLPALLQTPDYHRALLTTVPVVPVKAGTNGIARAAAAHEAGFIGDVDRHMQVLTRRQQRLEADGDEPLDYHAFIDEAVLHRLHGGREVMRRQLDRLLEVARDRPTVTVRVVPFDRPVNTGLAGSFGLMEFGDPELEVAHTDGGQGTVIVDGGEARRYRAMFEALAEVALSQELSRRRIEERLRSL